MKAHARCSLRFATPPAEFLRQVGCVRGPAMTEKPLTQSRCSANANFDDLPWPLFGPGAALADLCWQSGRRIIGNSA
jgi:hypothetical protein